MKKQQLEIRLTSPACHRSTARLAQRRVSRARWWFGQMRRVVDDAIAPPPPRPPEQIPLPLPLP